MQFLNFRTRLILALVLITVPAYAHETLTGPVQAEVLSIVDGDTLRVRAHQWLNQSIEVFSVRIRGIDTPELHQPRCAQEAKRAQEAKDAITSLINRRTVTLYNISYDKYAGRVVARVLTADTVDIGVSLIRRGDAAPWEGQGTKHRWCR